MPTLLGYLNYDKDYFAFGYDVNKTDNDYHYTYTTSGNIYQVFHKNYSMQYDLPSNKVINLYDFKDDFGFKENLKDNDKYKEISTNMLNNLKAFAQQYHNKMNNNDLSLR
ncbi:MAG: hypothetical protein HRT66_06830 [Flavobacteriaceae bacterium]|nr:hypothetical protein [Flavobacteriaceae bacterium]